MSTGASLRKPPAVQAQRRCAAIWISSKARSSQRSPSSQDRPRTFGRFVPLGRKIAPTIYAAKDLARRVKKDNAFVTRVLAQPKVWLIGDERALAA